MRRCAIIGAGAAGTALALRLVRRGLTVEAVVSRDAQQAHRLAARLEAPVASAMLDALPASSDTVFCCTQDDALPALAAALAATRPSWKGGLVAHLSGAVPASVLQPLADRGALVLGFHPIQSFTRGAHAGAFDGIVVGLEGNADALAAGRGMARALGVQSIDVPTDEKASYHLACVLASNILTTVMQMAAEALAPLNIDEREATRILGPLVDGTLRNIRSATAPAQALTGPIARGDIATLARHIEALELHAPARLPTYLALCSETLRVAVAGGHLTDSDADTLRAFLHARHQGRA